LVIPISQVKLETREIRGTREIRETRGTRETGETRETRNKKLIFL